MNIIKLECSNCKGELELDNYAQDTLTRVGWAMLECKSCRSKFLITNDVKKIEEDIYDDYWSE